MATLAKVGTDLLANSSCSVLKQLDIWESAEGRGRGTYGNEQLSKWESTYLSVVLVYFRKV